MAYSSDIFADTEELANEEYRVSEFALLCPLSEWRFHRAGKNRFVRQDFVKLQKKRLMPTARMSVRNAAFNSFNIAE